jgi:hypothetical protein
MAILERPRPIGFGNPIVVGRAALRLADAAPLADKRLHFRQTLLLRGQISRRLIVSHDEVGSEEHRQAEAVPQHESASRSQD